MSAPDELQGNGGNKAKEGSLADTVHSFSSLGLNNLPTEQQPSTSCELQLQCEPSTSLNFFSPAYNPLESPMDENSAVNEMLKDIKKVAAHFALDTSDPKPGCSFSSPSTPKDQDTPQITASESNKKPEDHSTRVRPQPFKEFRLHPSDLPFTKEKLAQHLSLEEACGFLPYFMKSKREDLKLLEKDLDQVSAELQIALNDAKNICIKLEKEEKTASDTMKDLVVQAQKLMYLLSSSSRIFEKLDTFGTILKDGIVNYSSQADDYHASLDMLLEHVLESIYFKYWENDRLAI